MKISFSLFIWLIAIIFKKKILNGLISKYKTNVMLIIYIIKIINTPKCNIKQAQQIENSLSNFKDKIKHNCFKNVILNLVVALNYLSIYKF